MARLQKICSQQEKCIQDVKRKLNEWKIPPDKEKIIIETLLKEKFIDELRYSRSFVRDKFSLNEWGRIKIVYVLRQKKINERIIQTALEEIDIDVYMSTLTNLLHRKRKILKDKNIHTLSGKLIRYAQSKGFEYDIIRQSLQEVLGNERG